MHRAGDKEKTCIRIQSFSGSCQKRRLIVASAQDFRYGMTKSFVHTLLLRPGKAPTTLRHFYLSRDLFTQLLLLNTFSKRSLLRGAEGTSQVKGKQPAGPERREVHIPPSPSIIYLHSVTQKNIDETLRFYLSNRAWFGFRRRRKLYLLWALSHMQEHLQHLACDSSNIIAQVSCLGLIFQALLLLDAKSISIWRHQNPLYHLLLEGSFGLSCSVADMRVLILTVIQTEPLRGLNKMLRIWT